MNGRVVRTVTALKRWSCQDKTLPPVDAIKAIHIYDFDNTREQALEQYKRARAVMLMRNRSIRKSTTEQSHLGCRDVRTATSARVPTQRRLVAQPEDPEGDRRRRGN